jgi:pyridinium-3,5-biscarboxylic acid mononucleotide sulfurtransferase
MNTHEKYTHLANHLKSLGKITIAFSGGIDSLFLLHTAVHVLGHENVAAITIKTPYISNRDLDDSLHFSQTLGVAHHIIPALVPEHIRSNPTDRCYYCKKFEFTLIINKSHSLDISNIAAGINADDANDYRPGTKAMKELNVLFPLQEALLSKNEIRQLAHEKNINYWNKPANACLLSRIPYGNFISDEKIEQIQQAEIILQGEGFANPRVRTHGDFALIEIEKNEFVKFIDDEFSYKIYSAFIKLGYAHVTLDIRGYHSGSMNEGLI